VAARGGGGDPDTNPRLRTIIAEAKQFNMPAENIKRAIRRGTGEEPGVQYDEITYEGYGPGGVAIIIEAMTDNKNRTTAEIRHLLSKYGGNMASSGAVAFQFSKKGYISVEKKGVTEDALMELALEAGAEDFSAEDAEVFEITTDLASFEAVKAKVEEKGFAIQTAEVQMVSPNQVAVGDKAPSLLKLIDFLEDNDDVQKVWSNGDIEDKYLEE
jgi:YebC/PmpR family DNA-binding regulatory protein